MRVCALCGEPIENLRRQARFCGDAHRVEANRLVAILSGSPNARYPSLRHRLNAAKNRTRALYGDRR